MNSFTRTLNLAIPIAYALGSLLGLIFYALLVQAMLWLGIPQSLVEALGGGLALLFTIAISYKVASGLIVNRAKVPQEVAQGHVLLAVGNLAAIGCTVGPVA